MKWEYCLMYFDPENRENCSIIFIDSDSDERIGATYAGEENRSGITRRSGWKWNTFDIKRKEIESLSGLSTQSSTGLLIKSLGVLGSHGWELVSQQNAVQYYFKRQIK